MKRWFWLGWMAWAVVVLPGAAEEPAAPMLPPAELVRLLQTHFVDGAKVESVVEQATVQSILKALGPGVKLLPASEANAPLGEAADSEMPWRGPVARAEIIEPNIGYVRIYELTQATVSAVDAELAKFRESKCEGLVLDLRFANGTDYGAAAAVAAQFLDQPREVFVVRAADGKDERFRAEPPARATGADPLTSAPLVVLVNNETRGAAEALAGTLRAQERGLLMGSPTAGAPARVMDIPVGQDQILRVATAKVIVQGAEETATREIFPNGLVPDIFVMMDLGEERNVVLHGATNVTLTVSLQPRVQKKRLSEADLMRVFRGEALDTNREDDTESRDGGEETTELQRVRDVVLQRAVDVLKGARVLLAGP
ncbi:MAG: S41 family peptidase [Verrucomicrobiae bacterium]|nr:S41 family peptidase [Verrucomicrobiae bacterium]MDW8344886.1 S41 family peptidase [Verrucomicrobiae bacterium]